MPHKSSQLFLQLSSYVAGSNITLVMILATMDSRTIMIANIMTGRKPFSVFPGISRCFDGSPKKYLIGSGSFVMINVRAPVIKVDSSRLTTNEPR